MGSSKVAVSLRIKWGGVMLNLEYYLKKIIEENAISDVIREEGLYEDVNDSKLKNFFCLAHHEINRLLSYLNSRLKNGHYNASESRQLIKWIDIIENTIYVFNKTETPIEINDNYYQVLQECKKFLLDSGGRPIPQEFSKVDIIEYEPIFRIVNSIEITHGLQK